MDHNPPASKECVLRDLLDRHAREQPDMIFTVFDDGTEVSWSEMHLLVRRTAAGLQALGVGQGDHVLSWLPNGLDALRLWFALNYIGAVFMPLNLDYRGRLLEHAIGLSDARLLVVDANLTPRIAGIDTAAVRTVVALGGTAELPGLIVEGAEALDRDADELIDPPRPIQPWDTMAIILTSGTTGPSKAVPTSYAQLHALSGPQCWSFVDPADRFMITLPFFHMGGICCVYAMLMNGGSIAMVDRYRTDEFWRMVAATGSTVVILMGAMAAFLAAAPADEGDRTHGLRVALIIPLIGDIPAFAARFGIEGYTVYNMTEISTPLLSDRNPTQPGVCGRPREGVEVRLVDEHDVEVAQGETGELIIRTDRPWSLFSGYYKAPEATALAWRNGWFHTGDAFRRDADGLFYFVDRQKDAIRRRGENISSFEVEAEVRAYPAVKEVAAVAVPSDIGEDEVMVCVVPREDATLEPAALITFLAERMPRFMVPRYVRILEDLPRTPTQKVQKHLLRADGICDGVFDREAAGIRISRTTMAS